MKFFAKKGRRFLRAVVLFLAGTFTLTIAGCDGGQNAAQSQFVLGTVCSINLYDSSSTELYAKLFARLKELNDIFNNYSDSSEITFVNQNAAKKAVPVSQDFYVVLKTALEFARLTDGAFDPTIGPLVKLWGFGKNPHVPSQEEIEAAQALIGWQNVVLDQDAKKTEGFTDQDAAVAHSVQFKKEGIRLDLGAIAKGYAADELVRILKEKKVKRAAISLGGNVYVYGKKRDGSLWNVAIRDPNLKEQNAFSLKTKDATVVTSGGYERFFEQDGKIYSHILNPATGFPADSGLASVTIVSSSSIIADALSTSLFVLGMEKIPEIKKSALAGNFECVCVDTSGKAYASKALKGSLSALKGQTIIYF